MTAKEPCVVWMRGNIGDLIILSAIANHLHMHPDGYDVKTVLISSSLPKETVVELVELLSFYDDKNIILLDKKYCDGRKKIFNLKLAGTLANKYRMRVVLLNHCLPFGNGVVKVLKADEILLPEYGKVDYTNVGLKDPVIDNDLVLSLPERYVVFFPQGNSNWHWQSSDTVQCFDKLIKAALAQGYRVVICAKGMPERHPYEHYMDKVDVTFLINQTSLADAAYLIRHASGVVSYDSGMKNIAFLLPTPTVAIYNTRLKPPSPIDAWFPKQLQGINNNSYLWQTDLNDSILERIVKSWRGTSTSSL